MDLWSIYIGTVLAWKRDQSAANGAAMISAFAAFARDFCPDTSEALIFQMGERVAGMTAHAT